MELRFYDSNLNFLGIVENQKSITWHRKYWECGSFEIHLPITPYILSLCECENIVSYRGASEAGVIEKVRIEEQIDLQEITIQGRFLSSYMDRRIIKSIINFSGTVEDAMRKLLDEMQPVIPKVELGERLGLATTVDFQVSYKNLLTYEQKLASTAGYGFRFRPDFTEKKILFEIYEGRDLTRGNSWHSFVEFSDDFNNLNSAVYEKDMSLYKTYAYVGGQGEGADRVITSVSIASGTGLNRREIFVDARDLSQGTLTDTQYANKLKARAKEKVKESYVYSEAFDSEVNPNINFVYKEDYDLGDIVTARKESWNKSLSLRITELTEVYENGAMTIVPTIGELTSVQVLNED